MKDKAASDTFGKILEGLHPGEISREEAEYLISYIHKKKELFMEELMKKRIERKGDEGL